MVVRIRAEDLGYALLLKEIKSRDDAIYGRDHLIANGLNPVINAVFQDCYHILLHGVSSAAFADVIRAADVELV